MSQENVEVVERAYDAIERRDLPGFLALLGEDFELDLSGHPIPDFPDHGVGAEHFVDLVSTYMSGFEDYTMRIVRLMEVGDEVVVLLHDSARLHGSEATRSEERRVGKEGR